MAEIYEKAIRTKYIGKPLALFDEKPAWVVSWPRTVEHHHTYGLLTPFFKGLTEGNLMATKCVNPDCAEKGTVWLPPRADCPDCYQRMKWVKVKPEGKIYTFTMVDYAGIGVEMKTPYWQIDVEIPGVDTIFKGYLAQGKPEIGLPVKAEFRTKNPTHTILDIWWVPK
ncbi:MAG: OB-fold domain-containing protein [Desulfarculus sp.]|nr:OB-fold domain-containing protein [Desulfarculus sp.]